MPGGAGLQILVKNGANRPHQGASLNRNLNHPVFDFDQSIVNHGHQLA
jgi:hypothetical protein